MHAFLNFCTDVLEFKMRPYYPGKIFCSTNGHVYISFSEKHPLRQMQFSVTQHGVSPEEFRILRSEFQNDAEERINRILDKELTEGVELQF